MPAHKRHSHDILISIVHTACYDADVITCDKWTIMCLTIEHWLRGTLRIQWWCYLCVLWDYLEFKSFHKYLFQNQESAPHQTQYSTPPHDVEVISTPEKKSNLKRIGSQHSVASATSIESKTSSKIIEYQSKSIHSIAQLKENFCI